MATCSDLDFLGRERIVIVICIMSKHSTSGRGLPCLMYLCYLSWGDMGGLDVMDKLVSELRSQVMVISWSGHGRVMARSWSGHG